MKVTVALFTSLSLFARFVSAHPFIIVAHITPAAVLPPTPTHIHVPRQNLLSDLESAANSVFGLTPDSSTTSNRGRTTSSASVRTVIPPATAAATTSSQNDDDDSDDDESTSSDFSSTTQISIVSPKISNSSLATPTSGSSTTVSSITSATGASQVTPTPAISDGNSGGVPPGGVAVAVIMSLLAVLVAAWLVFRYHPKCQAWYAAREAKKFQERSYRDALDGPSNDLRSQAMGGGASRRHTILKSFFAPATAKLGGGQEIRRKPVNWGAGSTHAPSIRAESPALPPLPIDMEKIPDDSGEKIPMTAAAAPMGQIERYSYMPPSNARELTPSVPAKIPELPPKTPTAAVSPLSMRADDDLERLPPISPLSHRGSHRAAKERTLPSLPPVPTIPSLNLAKRGSDGLFRLA